MIFSIPNLEKYLENKWVNCLCFEHTILLTESAIEYLLAKHQFKIQEKQYFKDHSIFFSCIKDSSIDSTKIRIKNEYDKNKKLFLEMQDYFRNLIGELNRIFESSSKDIYLFGAHLFSQYLIYHGLQTNKVKGILDNNPNKQGKRLYGTAFNVFSPKILKDNNNAMVILNAGAYNEEIKNDILENINANVEIKMF